MISVHTELFKTFLKFRLWSKEFRFSKSLFCLSFRIFGFINCKFNVFWQGHKIKKKVSYFLTSVLHGIGDIILWPFQKISTLDLDEYWFEYIFEFEKKKQFSRWLWLFLGFSDSFFPHHVLFTQWHRDALKIRSTAHFL